MEWFMSFYEHRHSVGSAPPAECTLRAGELLFVPRGWWHIAINLEESVAVTQNFVSEANLPHVLAFLRSRSPALVSGCAADERASLYDRFVEALRRERPELLARAEEAAAAAAQKAEVRGACLLGPLGSLSHVAAEFLAALAALVTAVRACMLR
jgi:hypothetical protein